MRPKGITDPFNFLTNDVRFEKNDKHRLLHGDPGMGIGNVVFDRFKFDKTIPPCRPENHPFKLDRFGGGDHTGQVRKAHIQQGTGQIGLVRSSSRSVVRS